LEFKGYDTGKGIFTKLSVYIVSGFDMDMWLIKINVKICWRYEFFM